MNGYMCSRLRHYYPLEFTTAYMNNADTEEDIVYSMELAKQYNISINHPKFRYSRAEYMCDKKTNSIYKGMSSIKYLNESISNELYYKYKDKNFNSFIELIHTLKQETNIDYRQLKILTTLNYFSEFGKNAKLLKAIDLYENLGSKKQVSKKQIEEKKLNEELIKKYSSKTTEKLYKEIDMLAYINEVVSKLENKSINIKEQIKAEKEYLGYETTTSDKLPNNVFIVTEIDTKYTPKVRLYNLKTGEIEVLKCKKNDIKKNPFGEFSIIQKQSILRKPKSKLVNEEWVKTEEMDVYLAKWEVIM